MFSGSFQKLFTRVYLAIIKSTVGLILAIVVSLSRLLFPRLTCHVDDENEAPRSAAPGRSSKSSKKPRHPRRPNPLAFMLKFRQLSMAKVTCTTANGVFADQPIVDLPSESVKAVSNSEVAIPDSELMTASVEEMEFAEVTKENVDVDVSVADGHSDVEEDTSSEVDAVVVSDDVVSDHEVTMVVDELDEVKDGKVELEEDADVSVSEDEAIEVIGMQDTSDAETSIDHSIDSTSTRSFTPLEDNTSKTSAEEISPLSDSVLPPIDSQDDDITSKVISVTPAAEPVASRGDDSIESYARDPSSANDAPAPVASTSNSVLNPDSTNFVPSADPLPTPTLTAASSLLTDLDPNTASHTFPPKPLKYLDPASAFSIDLSQRVQVKISEKIALLESHVVSSSAPASAESKFGLRRQVKRDAPAFRIPPPLRVPMACGGLFEFVSDSALPMATFLPPAPLDAPSEPSSISKEDILVPCRSMPRPHPHSHPRSQSSPSLLNPRSRSFESSMSSSTSSGPASFASASTLNYNSKANEFDTSNIKSKLSESRQRRLDGPKAAAFKLKLQSIVRAMNE